MKKEKEPWLRPKTNKLYLQRPLSERICLLCPDMKLLSLSLLDDGTHVGQPGVGVHLLHGEEMLPFDLDQTVFDPVEAGIPIYTARNSAECSVALEAFCDGARNPSIHFKITLTNARSTAVESAIGLLPRSGQEKYMVNQHQEGYTPYRPNYKNWFMLKRTWEASSDTSAASDMGAIALTVSSGDVRWVKDAPSGHAFDASDYFRINYRLLPGESMTVVGVLRAAIDLPSPAYEEARASAVGFWKELARSIRVLPNTENERMLAVYRHCAIQCMQMLARYEKSDLVATRQGDVGRFVWPYEGVQILSMLDRIGLSLHTADAYRHYFARWFVSEGEDRGMIRSHAGWANFTGSVLFGASEHLLAVHSEEELSEFLPYLLAMRDWIEKKRREPRDAGYAGIFPIDRGSDWGDRAQFWTFTDSHNAMAYRSLAKMLRAYSHPEAVATEEMYRDYADTICKIRDGLHAGHEEDEAYILPHELGLPFEDTETYSYYTDGAPYLLYTGFIDPESKIRKQMEEFFRRRGQFSHGLTGRMTSCSSMWDEAYFGGYGDVWYTMQSEICWIKAWVAAGEREKAKETLDGILTWGMTREYVISERYCSINPWYSPWQPNGSGNARMMEILLEYYGEKNRE